jgi:putative DNA primase/helicase
VSEAYATLVRKLADTESGSLVRLDAGAKRCFDRWRAEVEAMLADGGQLELIRDWGGKLAGATARIAGVLHCVTDSPQVPLSEDTIKAAVSISRYLIQHARYVLLGMSHDEADVSVQAFHILNWIRRHEPKVFGQRDAHQSLKGRFSRAEDMALALKELESRGYIRRGPKPQTSVGRPPSPVWEVNPAFLNDEPPARREAPPVTLEPPRCLPNDDETGRSQISL